MDVNRHYDISCTTNPCIFCRALDLPCVIMHPKVLYDRFWNQNKVFPGINRGEGSCPWCTQLTRLIRTSFGDKKSESLPKNCRLNLFRTSHPVLPGYEAAYFSLGPEEYENVPPIYLLPSQARFMSLQSGEHTYLPCARALDSCPVDYAMFNDRIKLCQSEHSATCGSSFDQEFKPARLIDCKTSRLCAASDGHYVCLSYVWGDASAETTISDNQTLSNIPQTVSDAMFVTLELGMRYLWVDRYCIDQDNPEEKHNAIRNMDSIYRNAFVTIIAAAGSDSDYGLPGVSRRRKAAQSLRIGSHNFMVVQDPFMDIGASVWNKRGWTYQEMLLSRRRLIFTDRQVYFQCQTHQAMEELNKDFVSTDLIRNITKGKPFLPRLNEGLNINDFYDRIEEYCVRTLRYKTDNINAFAGVFRQLSGRTSDRIRDFPSIPELYMPRPNPHFYGIPLWLQKPERPDGDGDPLGQLPRLDDDGKASLRFGLNLGWRLEGEREDFRSTLGGSIMEPSFPSWSWASVKDQRLKHSQCRLVYPSRPNILDETEGADFSAFVTHRSGKRMGMLAYAAQTDDYTHFHPWIDVVAYTMSGHLQVEEDGTSIFSALPGAIVYLDNDQKRTVGQLKALYVGTYIKSESYSFLFALFLLLEEAGQDEFRRIGLCTIHDYGAYLTPDKLFGAKEEFHLLSLRKTMLLRKLGVAVKWRREELRII